jgi:hypothetical protein
MTKNINKNAKKEAFSLFWEFYRDVISDEQIAKQCALITIDKLIKEQTMWQNGEINPILYWQDVKKEINNLVFTIEVKIPNLQKGINYESKTIAKN